MSSFFILKPFDEPPEWERRAPERLELIEAPGSLLARDVFCRRDVPPCDRSLRDGWAVRSSDNALLRTPAPREVKAGDDAGTLPANGAVWVNTGACIPQGADAVIPAADPRDANGARFAADPGDFVIPHASEWRRGDLVLPRGTVIGAREEAVLAENGIGSVVARRFPAVGIVATGSEIARGASPESPRQRTASDAFYLKSLLLSMGAVRNRLFFASDSVEAIAGAVAEAAAFSDIVVTIGGTGLSSGDMTRSALVTAGGRLLANDSSVKLSGGAAPFISGSIGGKIVIGLPGHPLGAMMIAQRVLLPLVWRSARDEPYSAGRADALFASDMAEGVEGEICVELHREGADLIAHPVRKGSGRSRIFREAGGVVIPHGNPIARGDAVTVELFRN